MEAHPFARLVSDRVRSRATHRPERIALSATTTKYVTDPRTGRTYPQVSGGGITRLASDALGSPNVALDASSGTVVAQRLYRPYGAWLYSNGTMPGSYGFTGQHTENSSTAVDYYGARYYDPTASQFTSADTVLDGLNRYAYVQDNPETFIDPTGHFDWGDLVNQALNVGATILNDATGYQAMGQDVQVLANPKSSFSDDNNAFLDLDKNVVMDLLYFLPGVDEGDAAGRTGADVAEHTGLGRDALDAAEHLGGDLVGDLGDALEHASGDATDHAGADLEHVGVDAGTNAGDAATAATEACSFAYDTPVATPSGEQAIGALKVGDQVIAYDPSTGQTSTQSVQHVWINHDNDLLDVTLTLAGDGAKQTSGADASASKAQQAAAASHGLRAPPTEDTGATAPTVSETVHTTDNHPWLTADKGWVPAGQLRVGERAVREDGSPATVVALHVVSGAADYYNLTVSQLHTYVVGNARYVVHNEGCRGGGATSRAKGDVGRDTAQQILESQGYPNLQPEVAFQTPEGKPRLDLAGRDGNTLIAAEAKNGPGAVLSAPQQGGYPYFINEDVANIVPVGKNAGLAGLQAGVSLEEQGIERIKFFYFRFDLDP